MGTSVLCPCSASNLHGDEFYNFLKRKRIRDETLEILYREGVDEMRHVKRYSFETLLGFNITAKQAKRLRRL
jgi:hypothetical protein